MGKTIIAGGRDFCDYDFLKESLNDLKISITEIVSGKAKGVDALGEQYAKEHGIEVKEFPADWKKIGRGAGPIRNEEMAVYADTLVAYWDGKSKGTKSMITLAKKHGLKVHVIPIFNS